MCISFSPPSFSKEQVMDTSYFVYEDDTGIIIPYPSPSVTGIQELIAPFETKVGSFYKGNILKVGL